MLAASASLLASAGLALAQSQLPYPIDGNAPSIDAGSVAPAVSAAKAGDVTRARAYMANFSDPAARKLVLWELLDAYPEALSFVEADGALHDLVGWPHEARRIAAAEKQLASAGLAPSAVVAWFGRRPPATAQGALALASALNATGQVGASADVIRLAWRTLSCDQDTQDAILARFGAVLTVGDHIAREDLLLYGPQGPATQDMVRLLPPDQQALAFARIAVRGGDANAPSLIGALAPALQTSAGLAYERALSLDPING